LKIYILICQALGFFKLLRIKGGNWMSSYDVRYNWPIIEFKSLDDIIEFLNNYAKQRWLFRGQSVHAPLLSLIDRGKLALLTRNQKLWLEDRSIRQFLSTVKFPADPVEARILLTNPDDPRQLENNRISILMLMQHYGVPTRLIDWTTQYEIALHFAVTNNYGDHDDEDGEIWCFDEPKYEEKDFGPSQWVNNPQVKDTSGKFNNDLPIIFSQSGSKKEWIVLQGLRDKFHRMVSQDGYFTVSSHFDRDHACAIQNLFKNDTRCYCRCVINKGIKTEARDYLQQKGISQGSLFPDVAGVAWALRKDIFDLDS
jgi:hypothetical protein